MNLKTLSCRRSCATLIALSWLSLAAAIAFADEAALDKLQGKYTHRFTSGYVDGTKYQTKNTLEVLKLSSTTAYFRTHLNWANGHTCDLSGIAELQTDGSLLFSEKHSREASELSFPDGTVIRKKALPHHICLFSIRPTAHGLIFGDQPDPEDQKYFGGVCRQYACGNRGELDGVEFKHSERRKLTNTATIKQSEDFKTELDKYTQATKTPADQQAK